MRLAVLADIHADVHALRDALASAERLGCKQAVCAGDTVGWGRFPEETVTLVCGRGLPCVRGNHDRWAATPPVGASAATVLSNDALAYLGGLPRVWGKVVEGVRLSVCHGTPTSDMDGIDPGRLTAPEARALLDGTGADVLVVGHTHAAFVVQDTGGGMIINPGALLREPAAAAPAAVRFHPRRRAFVEDAQAPRGTFGVLDLPSRTFTLHRAADGTELPIPVVNMGVVGHWR
jgi:predicted phosphodiesterase